MKDYSMQELAFIGDAIHTSFVRNFVVKNNNLKLNELHRLASQYCNAKKQSLILDKIITILNEEELNIVRMARNSKAKHTAKNANPAEYHKATAFEALIGWLYLHDDAQRLNEILNFSIEEKE